MRIKKLSIINFRNYDKLELNLNSNINIIYGENGVGKTNLIESIYILAFTKSHRFFIDNNLIKKNKDFSHIKGEFIINNIYNKLEVNILKNKKILKKDNKEINKISDYISIINLIIFQPEDLEIIKGSPNNRRLFINIELSQLYGNYVEILNKYNKILKMRNNYLKNNLNIDKNYYEILTDHMINYILILIKIRRKFINKINKKVTNIYKNLTGIDNFYIKYVPNIDIFSEDDIENKNQIKETYKKIMNQEIKYKLTILGPQKDDLEFYIEDKNLKYYGSQGQQRMAILAFKLAEIEIIKEIKHQNPIILLDDVFSELDIKKRNNLLKYIKNNGQVIITTTDLNNIDENILKKAKKIKIKDGKIVRKGDENER